MSADVYLVTAYAVAIFLAFVLMYGALVVVRAVAGHTFQPSEHPNGRCAACGLDPQEHR